jgi:putative nucleotidyltransferase with HDIG domain
MYITQRTSPVTIVFNSAQQFLSAGLAGVLVNACGLKTPAIAGSPSNEGVLLHLVVAASAFVLAMHFINTALLSLYLAAQERAPVSSVLREIKPLSDVPSNLVLALVGVVLAALIAARSWIGVVLLVVPVLAVRKVFRIYTEMAEAYSHTVGALVGALEEKDPYTRGHSDRVAKYCCAIGQEMRLSARDMVLLERAALLHDIGKMGVPETVLRSSRPLSPEETAFIRQHPVMGAQVLEGIDFLEAILVVVRSHHERLDGAGYPGGASANDVPLLARIISVADAFDAMTSDRPYRSRLPVSHAIRELKWASGVQFDSAVVAAFLKALPSTGMVEPLQVEGATLTAASESSARRPRSTGG